MSKVFLQVETTDEIHYSSLPMDDDGREPLNVLDGIVDGILSIMQNNPDEFVDVYWNSTLRCFVKASTITQIKYGITEE